MQKRRITVLVGSRIFGIDVNQRSNYGQDMESRPTYYDASLHEFTGNGIASYRSSYRSSYANGFDSYEEAFAKSVESLVVSIAIPETEDD